MALGSTLFFSVPSTEARENVALYLLITLAPFALIGPFLGGFFARFPGAYRGGLVVSAALRALVAIGLAIWLDTYMLFPMAFLLLVLSRFHGISRSSVVPIVLDDLLAARLDERVATLEDEKAYVLRKYGKEIKRRKARSTRRGTS